MDRVRRIAVATALAVSVVGAVPGLALAVSTIGVEDDFFSPARSTLTVGDSDVEWVWDLDGSGGGATQNPHNVLSRDELFDSELVDSGSFERRASAGTFDYLCTIHSGMTGKLRVKPQVEDRDDGVLVRWAGPRSNTGDRFDVQIRREPNGPWRDLQEGEKVKKAGFSAGERRALSTLRLRVRSQRGSGSSRQSGWSPVIRADLG